MLLEAALQFEHIIKHPKTDVVSVDWLRLLPEGAPELPPGLGRILLGVPKAGGPEALEAPGG